MWQFELEGDAAALRLLSDALEDERWTVHERDRAWFIATPDWDELEHGEAIEKVQSVVESLSGAASLILDWPARIVVGNAIRIDKQGSQHYYMNAEPGAYEIRTYPASITTGNADGTIQVSRPGDPAARWLRVAAVRDAVQRVLRIYSRNTLGWRDLYNLLEIIRGDAPEAFSDWIPEAQFERFRRTANSVEAVGDEARHGKLIPAPPKVMTLAEARSLVRNVAHAWLQYRADS